MATGSFPGAKCGRGVLLTTHPLLVPRSWKSRAILYPASGPQLACNGTTLQFIYIYIYIYTSIYIHIYIYKGKIITLQAWSGKEDSRKLRFLDYITTAQDGGKFVSPTHRPPLPPGNLSRPQDQSAIGRIMSMKNSNDTIWNRTSDLPICSTAP